MRVQDYLGLDAKRMERIKATTTFVPPAEIHEGSQAEDLPPFEGAVVRDIIQRSRRAGKEVGSYPSLAQVVLCRSGDHQRSDCASDVQRGGLILFPASEGLKILVPNLRSLKVSFIDISGGGEPTLYPDFHQVAQTCRKGGFRLALETNGVWSNVQTADSLVHYFSFLRINLDASNDQVYDRIHGPGQSREFQRVLSNVERLIREKQRAGSQLIVGGEALLTQTNMNFVEEISALARDVGLDYIRFRAGTELSDSLLPEQRERAGKLIEETKARVAPFPVYEQVSVHRAGYGCRISPYQLVIDSSGRLYACSRFYQRPDLRSFGNLFSQPADKLWLGLDHSRTIKLLRTSECSIHDCPWRFCSNLPQHAGR